MGTRTVRLDDETEKTLARLRKTTGLSISEVLKRGVKAYAESTRAGGRRAYDVYRRLELGAGGWSIAPASAAKSAVKEALRRKHRR